jgi:hypothetical protein
MNKKIAIMKIGTTIRMRDHSQTNPKSAPYEIAKTVEFLANKYPENTYVVVGRNDLDKMETEEYDRKYPHANVTTNWKKGHDLDNLPDCSDIDYGIVFSGSSAAVNKPNHFRNKDGKLLTTLCCFANYAAPAYWVINEFKMPWIYLGLDNRYIFNNVSGSADLQIPPSYIGTLVDAPTGETTFFNDKLLSTEQGKYRTIDCSIPTEMCFQYVANYFREPLRDFDETLENKTGQPLLSLNNQNISCKKQNTTDRWQITHDYILNQEYWKDPEKVAVIGDWGRYLKQKRHAQWIDDPRMLGNIDPRTRIDQYEKHKYSFIISMATGASSGKYLEMVIANVFPLLIEDYDEMCNLVPKKHVSRIDSPERLQKVVDYLEANPDGYRKCIEKQRAAYPSLVKDLEEKFMAFMDRAEVAVLKDVESTKKGLRTIK